jgi:hypothetical protein
LKQNANSSLFICSNKLQNPKKLFILSLFQYLKSFRFFYVVLLLFPISVFSQKIALKKLETNLKNIEITSIGLDDLVIENSVSNTFEIVLYSDDAEKHHIVIEEKHNRIYISFEAKEFQENTEPVMKPITERLKRANAVLKIPKHRNVNLFGLNNNISAINFIGDLSISIDNGIIKLGEIQNHIAIKLYAGNVFAFAENTNINVISSLGKIKVDEHFYEKKFSLKDDKFSKHLIVNTIKAHTFLQTNK